MKKFFYCLLAATLLLMTGCIQQRYDWGNYDQKLYDHYKNPAEYDQFIEDLQVIIAKGETTGKVPPGIYAEYGYTLYEKGNLADSIVYFKKEMSSWPESNVLMAKMINNAQNQQPQDEKMKSDLVTNTSKTTEVSQ